MSRMVETLRSWLGDEDEGATVVEYGILVAGAAVLGLTAYLAFGLG